MGIATVTVLSFRGPSVFILPLARVGLASVFGS
jgi:hypothetical protein